MSDGRIKYRLSALPDWQQMVDPGTLSDSCPEVMDARLVIQGRQDVAVAVEQVLKRMALQYAAMAAATDIESERLRFNHGYAAIMTIMATLLTPPERTPQRMESM